MEHASWSARSEKCCRARGKKKEAADRNRVAMAPKEQRSKCEKAKEEEGKTLENRTRGEAEQIWDQKSAIISVVTWLSCRSEREGGWGPESTRSDCSSGPRLRAGTSARVAITTCAPCKHTYGILSKTSHMLSRCPQLTSRSCLPCQAPLTTFSSSCGCYQVTSANP